jgi:hypothetical protein
MVFLGFLVLLGLGLRCGFRFCGVCIDTNAAVFAMVAAFPNYVNGGNIPATTPALQGIMAYVAVFGLKA